MTSCAFIYTMDHLSLPFLFDLVNAIKPQPPQSQSSISSHTRSPSSSSSKDSFPPYPLHSSRSWHLSSGTLVFLPRDVTASLSRFIHHSTPFVKHIGWRTGQSKTLKDLPPELADQIFKELGGIPTVYSEIDGFSSVWRLCKTSRQ